uniref:Integrator complex subunit 8 n=1 Tax=Eptatretus burgeri TaxID=7764 RepID=A0A8C4QE96_EPTBU
MVLETSNCGPSCNSSPKSWFEFLLNESLLSEHLQQVSPKPSAVALIGQFLEQALKPVVNDQNQVQPPVENLRTRKLKLLALCTAAHLRWDLPELEKGLTVPIMNVLLSELLLLSRIPSGTEHGDLNVEELDEATAAAVYLYHRWCLRAIVEDSFPMKTNKPGHQQPNILNQMQQEKELVESILKLLKEKSDDSVQVLEGALKVKRELRMHTAATLELLSSCLDSDHERWPRTTEGSCGEDGQIQPGQRISVNELHCQVRYDLGCYYFLQGPSNISCYEKAKMHFGKTKELLDKIGLGVGYAQIDCQRLKGYSQACNALLPSSAEEESSFYPYCYIRHCLNTENYKGMVDMLLQDNAYTVLPRPFRRSLLMDIQQQAWKGVAGMDQLCFRVCTCNTVQSILYGEPVGIKPTQFFQKPNKEKIEFFLEVCQSVNLETASAEAKNNLGLFFKMLCLSLDDTHLTFLITSHALFMAVLRDDERQCLLEVLRKRQPKYQTVPSKPPFQDISSSASTNVGQLEQQLILTQDPWKVRQLLIELHGMTADRQFWMLSRKWEVPAPYAKVILTVKDLLTRDLIYILLAKAHCCLTNQAFHQARQLYLTCLEVVMEFWPRMRQLLLNEMLLLDILRTEDEAGRKSRISKPLELFKRVYTYLESWQQDVPTRALIAEQCVCFLLNYKDLEYLSVQVSTTALHNKHVKLGQLLAGTCRDFTGPKESRRSAKELWEAIVLVFTFPGQAKKGGNGKGATGKMRDASAPTLTRKEFVTCATKLKEPMILTILLSLMVKLHNTVRDEIVNDVSAEFIPSWPSSLPNLQAVDVDAVSMTIKELLRHALHVDPNNPSWLITQADFYFATSQYAAARHHYLQAAAVSSELFHKPIPPEVLTDQVLKQLIKCCSLLGCHTQAAIFCQFLKEVDYPTAFKALQEQNSNDGIDTYYKYIWDTTLLEYLIHFHHKRGDLEKKQVAMNAIGQMELNASNPESVLQLAAQKRKKGFMRSLLQLYC